MKHFLVPTDLSETSQTAVRYAQALAKLTGAEIILFQAFHPVLAVPQVHAYLDQLEMNPVDQLRAREQEIQELSERMTEQTGILHRPLVEEGLAGDLIAEVMETLRPDLTIMGTHGASGVERAIFGSVTAQVMKQTKSPLLVIPPDADFAGLNRIVYASDYHDSDIPALQFLNILTDRAKPEIQVLHVADGEVKQQYEESDFESLEHEMREHLPQARLSFHLVSDERVSEGILRFAQEQRADLLCVARKKRSLFLRFLMPSVTKQVLVRPEVPMLIFDAWDLPDPNF